MNMTIGEKKFWLLMFIAGANFGAGVEAAFANQMNEVIVFTLTTLFALWIAVKTEE